MRMDGHPSNSGAMHAVEISRQAWEGFIENSPQKTVYDSSFFHEVHGLPVRYWAASKGSEIFAAVAAIETENGMRPINFQNYNGLLLGKIDTGNFASAAHLVYEATGAIAEVLFQKYDNVYLYNHWSIVDVRPFLWLNYHQPECGSYKVNVQYTAVVNINQPEDHSGWQTLRRRDLAKAEKAKLVTKICSDIETLNRLQQETYKRQNIKRSSRQVDVLPKLVETLLSHDAGVILVTYADSEPVAAALFSYDDYRAYFMLGGSSDEGRKLGAGTKLISDSFLYFRQKRGLAEMDLVGANSPSRSAFKLGFGARLQPLLSVTKSSSGRDEIPLSIDTSAGF